MVFLNPTILFGLLAASIPVILHFLNLRKIKKIEFSTLSFLKELQKTKIRRIKFKQWLLLALRILIILFLVASFARPTLESSTVGGTASAAKTTAVFILDNSFSMGVVTERGSYFNQAKKVIKSLLSEFNQGDEVILITTSSPEKKIVSMNNLDFIEKQLSEIAISYISKNLEESILIGNKVLSESQNFNKEIYILSDFQKSRIHQSDDNFENIKQIFNDDVKLYTFFFGGKDVYNLSVTDLSTNNQIFELNKLISFTANVTAHMQIAGTNSILSLFINGVKNAQQSYDINKGETKSLNFETILKNSGLVEIVAELEDDEIMQDNLRYTYINVPEEITVLIIYDIYGDTKFVETALTSSSESNIKITKVESTQLNSVNLNIYDCVFLIGSEKIISGRRLSEFVESGGSIILMPGSNSTKNNLNKILTLLDIPFFGEKISSSNGGSINSFEQVDFNHPMFNNIFEKGIKPEIESPKIFSYFKTSTRGRGKSIITLQDNSAFLSEYKIGSGKLLIYNITPALSWSDLPLKGVFAPIINRSVNYLVSGNDDTENYLAGDKIVLNISKSKLPQIKVEKPDKGFDVINIDTLDIKNYLNYSNTDIIGIYKFYSEEEFIGAAAVNTNGKESNLDLLTKNEFDDYLDNIEFAGTHINLDAENDYKNQIYKARFGSELWQLFLLIVLILALVEMFVARSAKKDLADI